ncbi:hypothetical protein ACH5RR_020154 [Cinchona calisaya]|uniref:Gnk2-homologous domain-containing protein n=1 Tax=Cinchona calisaya TaxID=153742 RepID=A0ABD2ZDP0_9GENT
MWASGPHDTNKSPLIFMWYHLPDASVKVVICNTKTYNIVTDPFQLSVVNVLTDLVSGTPNNSGYDYRNQSPFAYAPKAYGHGTCTKTLSVTDCATCMQSAHDIILKYCGGFIGGKAFLNDCTIRYEHYSFTDL